MKALVNAKLITPAGIIDDGAVLFDQRIVWAGPLHECNLITLENVIDAKGLYVGPGFIDRKSVV